MNKNNFTYEAIKKSGRFSISILSEAVERNVIAELDLPVGAKWINSAVKKILPAVCWMVYR